VNSHENFLLNEPGTIDYEMKKNDKTDSLLCVLPNPENQKRITMDEPDNSSTRGENIPQPEHKNGSHDEVLSKDSLFAAAPDGSLIWRSNQAESTEEVEKVSIEPVKEEPPLTEEMMQETLESTPLHDHAPENDWMLPPLIQQNPDATEYEIGVPESDQISREEIPAANPDYEIALPESDQISEDEILPAAPGYEIGIPESDQINRDEIPAVAQAPDIFTPGDLPRNGAAKARAKSRNRNSSMQDYPGNPLDDSRLARQITKEVNNRLEHAFRNYFIIKRPGKDTLIPIVLTVILSYIVAIMTAVAIISKLKLFP